jgi:hypothetical protein
MPDTPYTFDEMGEMRRTLVTGWGDHGACTADA